MIDADPHRLYHVFFAQEMWMAGTEALNEQCPVKWVAVEGGVMTLYQLGQASVTSLIS